MTLETFRIVKRGGGDLKLTLSFNELVSKRSDGASVGLVRQRLVTAPCVFHTAVNM